MGKRSSSVRSYALMKKATLQIFPEWEETGNVAAWNRIVFFPDKFAWDTTQGTVHLPLSFFLYTAAVQCNFSYFADGQ